MNRAASIRAFFVVLVVGWVGTLALADDPPPVPTAPADSPIGRFLGRLLRGIEAGKGNGQPPGDQQEPAEVDDGLPDIEPDSPIAQDAVDERAPAGREQQRELAQARRFLDSGEEAAALTVLQRLLDGEEDTLILTAEGTWDSLQQLTEQTIGRSDAHLRKAYVERYGALAEEQLERAKRTGRPQDYAVVTKRFLHTPAGQEAARILAALSRDAGEPAEAAYWSGRMIREPGSLTVVLPPADERERPLDTVVSRPLTNWAQPFGGAQHHGTFPATDPVLIERWSQPITMRPAIAAQVADLVRDLVDSDRACIPATIPLVVNGRIITRTLRGLSVFDADTGRLQWESREGVSIERLLTGEDVSRPGGEPSGNGGRAIPPYTDSNADGHPLSGLLFRDGVYGFISSDGEQVFVLEDHASLSYRQPGYFWGQRGQDDPFNRDWVTNRLVAYDLETGSVRWQVGGERRDEPFDPQLAGTLFLGPPVVDRDELFLIGEQNETMFLFVLDRRTGEPKWSHAISEVGASIEQDLVRRWWPAQPAVGAGVVVCPTTAGWMVAVDRLQRRIRWSYRYIETRQQKVSSNRSRVASAGPLNSRWCPSAPIMTQRHVLFTPPELPDPLYGDQPRIVCLDLLTGERAWTEEKGDDLYVGGVTDGRVLVVGKSSVEAREVATGKRLWNTPLDLRSVNGEAGSTWRPRSVLGDVGQPSGRGVIAGDEFLLPLQSGQLWMIDVTTGHVRRTIALRETDHPLGNLLVDRGRLVSAGPFEVRSFEERTNVTGEVADLADPSIESLLRTAELQYLEGDLSRAHETLGRINSASATQRQQSQLARLRWNTLLQIVRGNLKAADSEFAELTTLATTDEQRLTIDSLRASRHVVRGELSEAFDVYWEQAQTPRRTLVDEGETSIRFDRWLAGRLRSLWDSADATLRTQFDERMEERVAAALENDDADLRWWADVLRFHPAGWKLRRALVERLLDDDPSTSVETMLLQLVEDADNDEQKLWVLDQLVRWLIDGDREADALACLMRYADGSATLDELHRRYALRLPADGRLSLPTWSEGTWKLTRSPASFNRAAFEPVLGIESGLPSVDEISLRIEPNLNRLSIESPAGEPIWQTPLQAQEQSFYNQTTGIASVGQLLFVVHRGVLHAISLSDRETLWRREFDVQSASSGYVRGPSGVDQEELRDQSSFVWSNGLRQMHTPMGMLALWRAGYVAYFGRHSLTLVDPLSGDVLWKRSGIAPRTMVYGTARTIYVVPPSPDDACALSVLDGSPLDWPKLDSLVSSAVTVTERGLVQVEEHKPFRLFGMGQATVRVRLVDPQTGVELWSVSFPQQTRFAQMSQTDLVAVDPDGAVSWIDCRLGESRLLGSIGDEAMQDVQRVFAVGEPGRLYVSFNKPPQPGSYSRNYQATPVNGTLAAFDTRGGMLWSAAIEDQNLVVDQLSHLPVLLLTSQRSERDGEVTSQSVAVELRDKETGDVLLEDSRYITGGNLREMEIDYARQIIDLKTYNDRLRLQVTAE